LTREITIEDFEKAVISEEPDRAKIKWRKRAWIRPKSQTIARPKTHRPRPEVYWKILKRAGRNLCVCELDNSDYHITVHHKDGNPYNNDLTNLQVLCWHCHSLLHDPSEEGIHHELEGTKQDVDPLDDAEVRRFLGIIDD